METCCRHRTLPPSPPPGQTGDHAIGIGSKRRGLMITEREAKSKVPDWGNKVDSGIGLRSTLAMG
jgi:hypothetical protein